MLRVLFYCSSLLHGTCYSTPSLIIRVAPLGQQPRENTGTFFIRTRAYGFSYSHRPLSLIYVELFYSRDGSDIVKQETLSPVSAKVRK